MLKWTLGPGGHFLLIVSVSQFISQSRVPALGPPLLPPVRHFQPTKNGACMSRGAKSNYRNYLIPTPAGDPDPILRRLINVMPSISCGLRGAMKTPGLDG